MTSSNESPEDRELLDALWEASQFDDMTVFDTLSALLRAICPTAVLEFTFHPDDQRALDDLMIAEAFLAGIPFADRTEEQRKQYADLCEEEARMRQERRPIGLRIVARPADDGGHVTALREPAHAAIYAEAVIQRLKNALLS